MRKLYWFNGHSLTLKEWAAVKRCKWQVLYRRVKVKQMPFEEAMIEPIKG
jgi:hypothetical protein